MGLGEYAVPQIIVVDCLRRAVRKAIKYENGLPMRKRKFLLEIQVNCVEDIIVKRDTANLGVSRKEVIQVISELGQTKAFSQADHHLDYLILEKRLTHLKILRGGGFSSYNDYRKITDFYVTTVFLAHDN